MKVISDKYLPFVDSINRKHICVLRTEWVADKTVLKTLAYSAIQDLSNLAKLNLPRVS
jgi:hypothetical protein